MILVLLILLISVLLIYGILEQIRPKNFPPGPWGVPILGYLPFLAPDSHIKIGKLGKKFGGVFSVKLGSFWFVVLNDYETIKTALKTDVFSGRPNYLIPMAVFKNGIVYNDGPSWVEQRRFALKTLRDLGFGKISQETSIQEEVKDLTDYLKERIETPIELKELFAISILNGLWHIVAGEKFSLDDPTPRKVFNTAKAGITEPEIQGPVYFLPWIAKLFPEYTGLNKIKAAIASLRGLLESVIEEHQRNFVPGSSPNDYIDVYLQEMENNKDNSNSSFHGEIGVINLVDSLMNLFVAGSDSLSCTLGFAFLYLTKHQDVLRKTQDEIDRVIGRKRLANTSDRTKMPYTECVINETYRLSSIIAGNVLHSITEDTKFMGYSLPKGTIIMPNLFQVHHDEDYWSNDVEEFKPERFLNPDGTFKKNERVIPFSIGKRTCMAESLAQVEFFLFLTGILQKFNVSETPEYPLPGFTSKSQLVLSSNPYKVILTERV